jgi:hypothetical protein
VLLSFLPHTKAVNFTLKFLLFRKSHFKGKRRGGKIKLSRREISNKTLMSFFQNVKKESNLTVKAFALNQG